MYTPENIRRAGSRRTCLIRSWSYCALLFVLLMAVLVGCGSGGHKEHQPDPLFVIQILSDQTADGDIAQSPAAVRTVTSAVDTGSVLVGIDAVSGDEYRGFLDFPLRGLHGVPLGASIDSATLEIFIPGLVIPASDPTLPVLMDLVTFQPPTILASDFDRSVQPPLLSMPFDFYSSDAGTFVVIDVTALMDEAQIEGLPDFQLRFVLDFIATSGLLEIEDAAADTAPLLTVTYY